jgi:hypothetical protein
LLKIYELPVKLYRNDFAWTENNPTIVLSCDKSIRNRFDPRNSQNQIKYAPIFSEMLDKSEYDPGHHRLGYTHQVVGGVPLARSLPWTVPVAEPAQTPNL